MARTRERVGRAARRDRECALCADVSRGERNGWERAKRCGLRYSRLACVLGITTGWFGVSAERVKAEGAAPVSAWSFSQVRERARQLAQHDFKPATGLALPDALKKLNYDEYHTIHFRPEYAPWRGESRFQVHLFHRGYLFAEPVKINLVENGQPRELTFSSKQFNYGGMPEPAALPAGLGFAGFKIVFDDKQKSYEIASFLGASYFRIVGMHQHYGASARALAVDTGEARPEEFPRFTEFWIEKPAPEGEFLQVYALLDSPSASGAYRFVIKPGDATVVEVEGSFFARDPERKFGIAPLTSMFLVAESRWRQISDFRPEVHDSDGLLVRGGAGRATWRPLLNPEKKHMMSRIAYPDFDGFGLLQRDRAFQDYQDLQARYDLRPSLWVKPLARWGPGAVELVEIPSDTEYNDNIVAYWVPETKPAKGQEFRYAYSLTASSGEPDTGPLLKVVATRLSRGNDKTPSKFVIDYSGDSAPALAGGELQAKVEAANGEAKNLVTQKNEVTGGWRVTFDLASARPETELRLDLRRNGKVVSETWNWRYPPE